MIRAIFEKKSSPFYRFGTLMSLGKIPHEIFTGFLEDNFKKICDQNKEISAENT